MNMLNTTTEMQLAKSRLGNSTDWFLQQINCNEINMKEEPID